jgi:predicted GNAT family N-acyltransferase
MAVTSNPRIEPLGKHHDRAAFDCGVAALNRYLREQAGQDGKKKIAATFILAGDAPPVIAGYYTLSSTSVNVGELPKTLAKKLPRYPLMPATLIGRLAVERRYQGKGCGELLLADALKRSLISTQQIGSVAVVVDAKDDNAKAFYTHFQFIPLVDDDHRLFLPMAAVQGLFEVIKVE